MRAPDKPTIRRPRGRPRMNPMRQTEDPKFMAASDARGIIDHHLPREKKKKHLLAALDACRACGGDPWPIIDALQMLDTHDFIGLSEKKRLTHKEAIRMTRSFEGLEDTDRDEALDKLRRMPSLTAVSRKYAKERPK